MTVLLTRDDVEIFDQVNEFCYPIIGYQRGINMVTGICNKFNEDV